MEIPFYQAKCISCGTTFCLPLLSDFSYGEFIARSENGLALAYLNAFEEPAFEEIDLLISNFLKGCQRGIDESSCLHYVVSKCSDRVEGQELRIDSLPVCPKCFSKSLAYDNIKTVGKKNIEILTFNSFNSLSFEEKRALIEKHITQFEMIK